jgi:hypothetical protein
MHAIILRWLTLYGNLTVRPYELTLGRAASVHPSTSRAVSTGCIRLLQYSWALENRLYSNAFLLPNWEVLAAFLVFWISF